MTFGQSNDTFSTYNYPPSYRKTDKVALSFFVTTRQENGLIMLAGNDNFNKLNRFSFISFKITNGNLCGDFVKCSNSIPFDTKVFIADGEQHMIEFFLDDTLRIKVDSITQLEINNIPVSASTCDRGYGFYIAYVYLGNIPKSVSRRRRSVDDMLLSRHTRQTSQNGKDVFDTNKQLQPFNGVLQVGTIAIILVLLVLMPFLIPEC